MTLLTLIRIIFLLSLGIHLLFPNEPCRVLAGVSAFVLGLFVLTGKF